MTEPLIGGPAARVMSLRDGTKKMSKSDPSDLSRINLTDDADAIASKIRKARTDAEPLPDSLAGLVDRAEARNLVAIYAALAGLTREQVIAQFGGQGFGAFKPALAELAVEALAPVTAEMRRLMNDPAEIDRVLADGAERAVHRVQFGSKLRVDEGDKIKRGQRIAEPQRHRQRVGQRGRTDLAAAVHRAVQMLAQHRQAGTGAAQRLAGAHVRIQRLRHRRQPGWEGRRVVEELDELLGQGAHASPTHRPPVHDRA